MKALAFWIVAPKAVQRAPFDKDGRANTRAVMQRKALDIKYCQHMLSPTSLLCIKASVSSFVGSDGMPPSLVVEIAA